MPDAIIVMNSNDERVPCKKAWLCGTPATRLVPAFLGAVVLATPDTSEAVIETIKPMAWEERSC